MYDWIFNCRDLWCGLPEWIDGQLKKLPFGNKRFDRRPLTADR
jgi:hypothetical protein